MSTKIEKELHDQIWNKYYGKEAMEKLLNYLNYLVKDKNLNEDQFEDIQSRYWIEYNEELEKNGLEMEMFF